MILPICDLSQLLLTDSTFSKIPFKVLLDFEIVCLRISDLERIELEHVLPIKKFRALLAWALGNPHLLRVL